MLRNTPAPNVLSGINVYRCHDGNPTLPSCRRKLLGNCPAALSAAGDKNLSALPSPGCVCVCCWLYTRQEANLSSELAYLFPLLLPNHGSLPQSTPHTLTAQTPLPREPMMTQQEASPHHHRHHPLTCSMLCVCLFRDKVSACRPD